LELKPTLYARMKHKLIGRLVKIAAHHLAYVLQELNRREEKASLRRTLVEIERNAAELRRLIGHIRGVS
jgi:hypothetical protein